MGVKKGDSHVDKLQDGAEDCVAQLISLKELMMMLIEDDDVYVVLRVSPLLLPYFGTKNHHRTILTPKFQTSLRLHLQTRDLNIIKKTHNIKIKEINIRKSQSSTIEYHAKNNGYQ